MHELMRLLILALEEVDLLASDSGEVLSEISRFGLEKNNTFEIFFLLCLRTSKSAESF
jgi:Cdc6-like AAA superfamily ATPase